MVNANRSVPTVNGAVTMANVSLTAPPVNVALREAVSFSVPAANTVMLVSDASLAVPLVNGAVTTVHAWILVALA